MTHIEKDAHFIKLRDKLLSSTEANSVEAILLELQDYLISNFELHLMNGTVNLLDLEIYYRNSSNYSGESTHGDNNQRRRCGLLYDHGKYGQRNGFDIVLSNGDYYLSCLVKGVFYEGTPHFKQYDSYCLCQQLSGVENLTNCVCSLVKMQTTTGKILHSRRINLTRSDKNAVLRSFNCSFIHNGDPKKSLLENYKNGYSKSEFLVGEMDLLRQRDELTEEKAFQLSRMIYGSEEKSIIRNYFRSLGVGQVPVESSRTFDPINNTKPMKKILYFDMDNVLVDFPSAIGQLSDDVKAEYEGRLDEVPGIFSLMKPMPGAIEAVEELKMHFDVYILSTSPWLNPSSWSDKLQWVQKYFGAEEGSTFYKRLILTHHKELAVGDFLVDDRPKNGASEFQGEWLHFGADGKFKDWRSIVEYLLERK